MYFWTLHILLNNVWDEETILIRINRFEKQCAPVVSADPWCATARNWEDDPADFATVLNRLRHFVESRRSEIQDSEIQDIVTDYANEENLLATNQKQDKFSKSTANYKKIVLMK